MSQQPRIVGIAGSLRNASYNRALLAAASEMTTAMDVASFELDEIPLFNQDVEDQGDPDAVVEMKRRIDASDGLLICTPEYQYGIPGVLKNALDWASRPAGDSVLQRKPVAVMGATPGRGGTGRAQLQLRQTLMFNDALVMGPPEVQVANVHKVLEGSEIVDDQTRGFVSDALERFARWIEFIQTGRSVLDDEGTG